MSQTEKGVHFTGNGEIWCDLKEETIKVIECVTVKEFEHAGFDCTIKRIQPTDRVDDIIEEHEYYVAYVEIPAESSVSASELTTIKTEHGAANYCVDEKIGFYTSRFCGATGFDDVVDDAKELAEKARAQVLKKDSAVFWWPEWVEGVVVDVGC